MELKEEGVKIIGSRKEADKTPGIDEAVSPVTVE